MFTGRGLNQTAITNVSVGGASLRLTLTTDGQPTRVPAVFQVLPAESPLLGYNGRLHVATGPHLKLVAVEG